MKLLSIFVLLAAINSSPSASASSLIEEFVPYDMFDCHIERIAQNRIRILTTDLNRINSRFIEIDLPALVRTNEGRKVMLSSSIDLAKETKGAKFAPDWLYGSRVTKLALHRERLDVMYTASTMGAEKVIFSCHHATNIELDKKLVCPTCISVKAQK